MNSLFRSRVRQCIIFVILLSGCFILVEWAGAQSPILYRTYLARIGRWRDEVRLAQGLDGAACGQRLEAVAAEMAIVTAVQMPNDIVMAVDHTEIIASLRLEPCDPARADSLLAGICPAQVCPVSQAPIVPESPKFDGEIPLDNSTPPQLGTPPSELLEEIEEQLQQEVGEGGEIASGPSDGGQQPVAGSGDPGNPPSGNDPTDEGVAPVEDTGGGSEDAPEESGDVTTESEGETADAGPDANGEGEPTNATDGTDADEEGASAGEGDSGVIAESGESESGDAAAESGGEAASTGTGPEDGGENGTENSGADAASVPSAEGETAVATAQPPEIAPPVATERPAWLWLVIGVAIVAMIVGAVLLLWESADDAQKAKRKVEPETPEEAVDEGRALIAVGNYRGAVRHLFLAALLTLDERNLLQYDATRTNYELLDGAKLGPVIVETLVPVIETFERVWYGFEVVGVAEYETLAGQIERLKQV